MAVDMQKQRSGETATNAAELYRFMQARGQGGGAGRGVLVWVGGCSWVEVVLVC